MSLIACSECGRQISAQAVACPSCGHATGLQTLGPEFGAYMRLKLRGLLILCLAAIPVGLVLRQPSVWGLGIFGGVVCWISLKVRKSCP
jgi:hypothetical protein